MLIAYRIAYGLVAALCLANLLNTHYYGEIPRSLPSLVLACKLSLGAVIASVLLFSRLKPLVIWTVIVVWELLFIWYAWFSPGAPFLLYQPRAISSMVFLLLFLWFASLALVRSVRPTSAWPKDKILSRS
ncbi:MAG TPA: hypothetical protein VMU05_07470 [Dongiaceae bacterium]|nr:hypothetical protein [Dongiaceae bacterium]